MNSEVKYYTITALNRAIKNMFESEPALESIYLKGEISNFKAHTRGHFYFTLKDETSRLSAVMFSSYAKNVNFNIEDGMKVLVHGRVSVYEATGGYQIYVDEIIQDGIGNLYIEFEKLKKKLASEGLFAMEHKKEIPKYPERIGIITASTGAAIRDILSTIKRRYPLCETILFPTLVQGEYAKDDIVRQLKNVENFSLDVIILGRGGGSIEDLWAFNEECVARAIYDCSIPIISAVGHEVDFTISDFVSDLRAPTPTGAAEMAVPTKAEVRKRILEEKNLLLERMNKRIDILKKYVERYKENYLLKNPMALYEGKEQRLDTILENINQLIKQRLNTLKIELNHKKESYLFLHPEKMYEKKEHTLQMYIQALKLLNPLNILDKGYSIIEKEGVAIKSYKQIHVNDEIEIRFAKGSAKATVRSINDGNRE